MGEEDPRPSEIGSGGQGIVGERTSGWRWSTAGELVGLSTRVICPSPCGWPAAGTTTRCGSWPRLCWSRCSSGRSSKGRLARSSTSSPASTSFMSTSWGTSRSTRPGRPGVRGPITSATSGGAWWWRRICRSDAGPGVFLDRTTAARGYRPGRPSRDGGSAVAASAASGETLSSRRRGGLSACRRRQPGGRRSDRAVWTRGGERITQWPREEPRLTGKRIRRLLLPLATQLLAP